MENDNQPRNLYERLDDTILKGVNAGVRAWNWTTGRTKADLANGLVYMGSISPAAGFVVNNSPIPTAVFLFLYGAGGLMQAYINKEFENKEINALNNRTKDISVETFKEKCKTSGYVKPILSVPVSLAPDISDPVRYGLDAFLVLNGISHQIMRADYLPPRKNCVLRGIEKLSEKLKNIELPAIPSPLPRPIPIGANYEAI